MAAAPDCVGPSVLIGFELPDGVIGMLSREAWPLGRDAVAVGAMAGGARCRLGLPGLGGFLCKALSTENEYEYDGC